MSAESVLVRSSFSPERAECRRAIDKRFGWLLQELERSNGNLSSLSAHQQLLWQGREWVVRRFNRIGLERDFAKRARAYQKLTRELERRRT